ncbi:hypothetical protein GC173_10860 [bacterium]|nr:hypothetical protein [bacterium]
MSSILDALEKASKERAARRDLPPPPPSAPPPPTPAPGGGGGKFLIVAVLAGLIVLVVVLWKGQQGEVPATPPIVVASATPVPPTPTLAPSPTPVPTATPAATPSPTPAPSPTPWPTPTPWPSPTPPPSPTPVPTAMPSPVPTPPPSGYSGVFRSGQIVRPDELGLTVTGVMEFGNGAVAFINGKEYRAGQKIGELHLIEVRVGLLTIDVGDGTVVKVRF